MRDFPSRASGRLLNGSEPSGWGRGWAVFSITLALLPLAAGAPTPVAAGSARATFIVSATVVPNCTTRGPTVVCTKGVTPPKAMRVRTPESAGLAQGRALTSISETDLPRSITVTVNF